MNEIETYFFNHQRPLYDLFTRAKKQDHWSHAYLLAGYPGQPLKNLATFLAQTLLCETPKPLACGNCLTCQRFQGNDYTDVIIIDGGLESIKKQEVLKISERFAITGLEKANKQIYILHLVEFMTPEAINALLKFLEEPVQEIYAVMSTYNLENVLPTIQSRSQVLHLKPIQQQPLIEEAVQAGMARADAEWLSFEKASVQEMVALASSPEYQEEQKHFSNLINHWMKNPESAHDYFRTNWLENLMTFDRTQVWIHRWIYLIREASKIKEKQAVILKAYVKLLSGMSERLGEPLQTVMRLQKRLTQMDKSTNLSLFLDATMMDLLGVNG